MNNKTNLVLGSIFLMISGLIYTIERLNAYLYMAAERIGAINGGSYSTIPDLPGLFDNLFVPLFGLIGIILLLFSFKDILTKIF